MRGMRDANFFTKPVEKWQRKYEAMRASFVDRLPDQIVAERFGFSVGYLRVLRHQFRHEKIDFSEQWPKGAVQNEELMLRPGIKSNHKKGGGTGSCRTDCGWTTYGATGRICWCRGVSLCPIHRSAQS